VSLDPSKGRGSIRAADAAGAFGAIIAALCCAGTPIVVGALAAVGLGFLRRDAVLWPVMPLSLTVALSGFWKWRALHHNPGPLLPGIVGVAALAGGMIPRCQDSCRMAGVISAS
jgi:mercuric ion transport protein